MDRGLNLQDLVATVDGIKEVANARGVAGAANNDASSHNSIPDAPAKGVQRGTETPEEAFFKPTHGFDFDSFLGEHGIGYNTKPADVGIIYRLDECWFDSSHGKNDASIILNTSKKTAIYKCFHDSCGKKPWDEAVRKIAGDEPLTKYFKEPPAASFDEFSKQIEESSDSSTLTHDVLEKIVKSELSGSDKEYLMRLISKKTKVSIAALREDARRLAADDTKKNPYTIAVSTIDELGSDNILMNKAFIWRWDGTGVWKITDERTIKKVIHSKTATNQLTKGLVESVLDLFKTEIYRENHQFDSDRSAINCLNGELYWDGSKWLFQDHCREHYLTTQIPITYDPNETAPRFEQFLDEIFRDDEDRAGKRQLIQEFMGYTLTTSTRFEKFMMLFGPGANGKSVLMAVISSMVGTENVAAVQPSQFGNKFQRAHLHNKLLNLVTEIAEGYQLDDAELKAIASGEMTTAEHKNKPPFDFKPFCTCWFGTNHMPHTRDFSDALFRRAMIVTCNRVFTESEQDRNLIEKLSAEKSGILNLALNALAGAYKRGHFTEPASMIAAKKQWRINADQAHQFVLECCDHGPGYEEEAGYLYSAFTVWAKACGLTRILTKTSFSQRLTRLGMGIELLPGIHGGPRRISKIRLQHSFGAGHLDELNKRAPGMAHKRFVDEQNWNFGSEANNQDQLEFST